MNLDRSEFRAWLESRPADEVAGACRKACTCPIARYLAHVTGRRWRVYRDASWSARGPVIDNPDWAVAFINLVEGDMVTGQPVSRGECLGLLDEVPR